MNEIIKVENGVAVLDHDFAVQIADFKNKVEKLKAQEKQMQEALAAEMGKRGILNLETPEIKITYVAPTERETFDSKTFRAEYPEMYDRYARISPVKECVRIKVK